MTAKLPSREVRRISAAIQGNSRYQARGEINL
jgi:hypothetical protein